MSASFRVRSVVLGTPAPRELAAFYQRMLGGEIVDDEADWVVLAAGGVRLAFQREPDHVRPSWPASPGDQQMQMHLDIAVDDLNAGVAEATASGAVPATWQPQHDVRVMLDPDGHPFCLFEVS